jgi:hypothetical protein
MTICVLQSWVMQLPMMQQSVLIAAIRGPDGVSKYTKAKALMKWYRRCVMISSFDKKALDRPDYPGGGSFTGPSFEVEIDDAGRPHYVENWEDKMEIPVQDFLRAVDELPHHYNTHFMHGAQILGYKHPDQRIRVFWRSVYERLVKDLCLRPEGEADMDMRLGDNRDAWLAHSDVAKIA